MLEVLCVLCVVQERIQEGVPALCGACGRHVAAIVAGVVGQPPDLALLASVTDFLLQLHPPTTRFINYTPAAFYLHPLWCKSARQAPRWLPVSRQTVQS